MDTREALRILELDDGRSRAAEPTEVDAATVRHAYRRLLRQHHPDVAGPGEGSHLATTALVEAHEQLLGVIAASDTGTILVEPDGPLEPAATTEAEPEPEPSAPPVDPLAVSALDEDTIAIEAPPDEAFALLYEAAARVGDIAYVDRQLGILETIVRFEGGPSCSVVMTLQGRALHTEVFCTIESIEATPAPPIAPVIAALVALVQGEPLDPAPG